MKVRHADPKMALVETDRAHKTGLPVAVIASARRKLNFLRQSADERDIRVMKSLRLEKLSGARDGEYSIRVNDQWRIILRFDDTCTPREIVILGIEDYH